MKNNIRACARKREREREFVCAYVRCSPKLAKKQLQENKVCVSVCACKGRKEKNSKSSEDNARVALSYGVCFGVR